MSSMKKIMFIAYDTLCTIGILAAEDNEAEVSGLLNQAKALALSVQSTLNMYDSSSELSKLCATYIPGIPVRISPMLYDFIRLNLEFSRQTNGAFDFTVGPFVKLWDFLAEDPVIPTNQELEQAIKKVGYQHIHLNAEQSEIVFDVAGMTLDPGASGKGYALEVVADFLKANGVKNGVLDFGGNLFVSGYKVSTKGKSEPWRVGIRNPDKQSYLGAVCLTNRGIATSSWYEHSFQKGGTVYHHLLNPDTGRPQEMDISSVSILSSQAVYTDLLSTAFFVMGFEAGCRLAESLAVNQGIDVDYIVLKKDGSLVTSKQAGFLQNSC